MWLIVTSTIEIFLIIVGFQGLVKGKMPISEGLWLEGWPARITGLLLMLPLPVALAFAEWWAGDEPWNLTMLSGSQTILITAALLFLALQVWLARRRKVKG